MALRSLWGGAPGAGAMRGAIRGAIRGAAAEGLSIRGAVAPGAWSGGPVRRAAIRPERVTR